MKLKNYRGLILFLLGVAIILSSAISEVNYAASMVVGIICIGVGTSLIVELVTKEEA